VTKIKVCGNTNPADVELAVELGVDLLGFIFTRSKRQISVDDGRRLTAQVPAHVERVGVFIDEPTEEIARAIEQCGLTAVQIYRPITPEDRGLAITLLPALRIGESAAIPANGFQPTDHPLLDTWSSETTGGGTGETWEWSRASQLARRYPVIVSGGLNPANVTAAIKELKPWGVDVCSGVELQPGKKDPEKLRAFVSAVRGESR
jgi:phosphoribosylanthranilate isomerase